MKQRKFSHKSFCLSEKVSFFHKPLKCVGEKGLERKKIFKKKLVVKKK